ncbi:MAG: 2-C-methyl-D-erythritol 4-phosphate cytidylyltransferase [Clostridium butyricum]|nr:2-C-methyl-D-erythritol 4-phosphate cytidylyltransferase [Clostridium butyricum]
MVTAILLAGGKGRRMASSKSKQYIELEGKPILYYTIKHFMNNDLIDDIILVLSEDEIDYCKDEVLKKYNLKINKIVSGGRERQESVYNGLIAANGADVVLIHDAARPFVSKRIIGDSIKYAERYKAAAPGVMPKDTIKLKNEKNFSVETPDRNKLVSVQTPQAFEYNMILKCHRKIKEMGISVTDDTMVVELFGNSVYIFDGEYTNIKITTPEDMILAKYLVNM